MVLAIFAASAQDVAYLLKQISKANHSVASGVQLMTWKMMPPPILICKNQSSRLFLLGRTYPFVVLP